MDIFLRYLGVIIVGGLLCVIAQILIDKTKLTSARILVIYVVAGVILSAIGVYDWLKQIGYCGATIPLTGFGHALFQGVVKATKELGFRGIFTGGLGDVATGIVMAIVFGVIASLVSKPKAKKP